MSGPTYVDDEAELLQRLRRGDATATEQLFRRHHPVAMGYAVKLCGNRDDACDVVSDAFVATFRAIEAGKGPTEQLRPYLFTAIRHLTYLNRKRRERVLAIADECVLDSRLTPAPAAESIALRRADEAMVLRALRSLPRRWQDILLKLDVEQLPVVDIAAAAGLPPNSVSALAYRARRGLTSAYLQEHITGHDTTASCLPYVRELGLFVRGELSTAKTHKLQRHLEHCPDCDRLARELHRVNQTIGGRRGTASPAAPATARLSAAGAAR